MKVDSSAPDAVADTSSEIMLQQALQRRALAMEQANLVDFIIADQWRQRLLKARMETPPAGYAKVTFEQLVRADQRLFFELQERTRGGIQFDKTRPLDDHWKTVSQLHEVVSLMIPMPSAAGAQRFHADQPKKDDQGGHGRQDKGAGKGKKGKGFVRMPTALIGCNSTTKKGENICFGFNLGTCSEVVKQGRCPKGVHVCCFPSCGGFHAFVKCQKAAKKPE